MSKQKIPLDKFKNMSQNLLDSYKIPINLNHVFDLVIKKWDDETLDDNFRLACSYTTYTNCYRLPNFECFKVYYDKYHLFGMTTICIVFISEAESVYVKITV